MVWRNPGILRYLGNMPGFPVLRHRFPPGMPNGLEDGFQKKDIGGFPVWHLPDGEFPCFQRCKPDARHYCFRNRQQEGFRNVRRDNKRIHRGGNDEKTSRNRKENRAGKTRHDVVHSGRPEGRGRTAGPGLLRGRRPQDIEYQKPRYRVYSRFRGRYPD